MTSTARTHENKPAPDDADDPIAAAAAPLDLLLADAALGPWRRFTPGMAGVRAVANAAAKPLSLAHHSTDLAAELGRILTGRSDLAPHPKDRRFADEQWSKNPLLKATLQVYLATGRTAKDLFDDIELGWRDRERLGFLLDNVIEASAPSNLPLVNPVTWRAAASTQGRSLLAGLKNLLGDMITAPRVPSMVDATAFSVGTDLAVSPGQVVLRTPVFELIQYAPTTPTVRRTPLLMVPPVINKYYIVDLAPGRSMVEYLVSQGQQVFVMSWRNPDARHRNWGFDTYGESIVEAIDAVTAITRSKQTHLMSMCSGGILAAMVAAHLAATGAAEKVATFNLGVTVLDQQDAGLPAAVLDKRVARAAISASARKGFLDGRSLAEIFAWLRPSDLIWSYWVNNYLQGKKPPAFDVLYWNADTTRMPAALHRDFVEMAVDNTTAHPGEGAMLGTPVDLGDVDVESYIVAGIGDHICRWQACYRSTQLLGGKNTFILSTAGHIASLVNPPTNPKSSFRTADHNPADAEQWLAEADTEKGSWWPHFADWLGVRSGGEKRAPRTLGNSKFEPLEAAPGTYVFDR
ncbi:alpha/beta fold hydrolase [Flexivirga sp. ID2601S]|uniref:Alpha/beta fold hydrolase n=1 Tax=Flexivirga aerilata TaxID=1656889 RepID=A0A849AFG2_9MICO|nr:alpha/beta fold hydrolase [Flexivirga aerilata]NNG37928.1 alpha/beta fold hydrolase [Flexivirga aerilata]